MSRDNNDFHPFNLYKINTVVSFGNKIYLRRYIDVLWIITDLGKDSYTARSRVYNPNPYSVKEYNLTSEEIQKFNEFIEDSKGLQKKNEEKLLRIKQPLIGAKTVDFKNSQAVTVLQDEYAVTKSTSEHPILGTFGAGPCVILALYDDEKKIAILAHIGTLTNIDSLSKLFYFVSKENTVAHLFGGNCESQDHCLDIVAFLEKNNIKIVNTDVARDSFDAASLAIDSRTGTIYSPIDYDQLSESPDVEIRMKRLCFKFNKTPIVQCYNGLDKTTNTDSLFAAEEKTELDISLNPIAPTDVSNRIKLLSLESDHSNMQHCFNGFEETTSLKLLFVPEEKLSVSPHSLFFASTSVMDNLLKEHLILHRHKSPGLQIAYDRQFSLILNTSGTRQSISLSKSYNFFNLPKKSTLSEVRIRPGSTSSKTMKTPTFRPKVARVFGQPPSA